jgi:pilus assembly protein CpaB
MKRKVDNARSRKIKLGLNKNVVMLFLSLGLGAAGVYYSREYIEDKVNYYRAQLEKTEEMASVVVPKRKLLRGEIVSPQDLALREMPIQYVDSNSVNGANYETAVGQRVSYDVDEGRPLLWAHLEGGLTPTFSGKVPSGMRAITVAVDEINSFSGFLQPKDRVDLLLTHGSGENSSTYPLIQNLDVMATGVKTVVDKTGQSAPKTFRTITVKVTDEEAKKITLAYEVGKLTAMLRNPEDEAPLDSAPMTANKLLNKKPPVKKNKIVRRKTEPGVEFIVGGI